MRLVKTDTREESENEEYEETEYEKLARKQEGDKTF